MEGVPGEGGVRVDALVGALRVDDPRALLTPGCTARAIRIAQRFVVTRTTRK